MISVIIPNYNGRHLLEKFLPKNVETFRLLGVTDIVIADDASTDDSVAWLNTNMPQITVVANPKNVGFSTTANLGAKAAKGTVYFFLNNDMDVSVIDLSQIQRYLAEDTVAAVTPRILRPQKKMENESITRGYFKGGWFYTESRLPKGAELQEGQPLLWGCGGAVFFKADIFWFLGGFDEIYLPFYVEDLTLSYKAWRCGWRVVYNHSSVVLHEHMTTIKTYYSARQITHFHLRNKYLFIWQVLETRSEWLFHAWWIFKKILRLEFVEWSAMMQALKRLDLVKDRRRTLKKQSKRTNEDVLNCLK
jgi:O-antigen biosynthesis protein